MSLRKFLLITFAALILFSQGYSLVAGVTTAGGQITEALEDLDLEEIVPCDPFLPSISQRCSPTTDNVIGQLIYISLLLVCFTSLGANQRSYQLSYSLLSQKRRYRPVWLEKQRILL